MDNPCQPDTPSPALDCVIITQANIDKWRRENKYPTGRIGVIFGTQTAIHCCEGVDPKGFDFYPITTFPNGILLFERGVLAYRAFRDLHPTWEIIF
jgi:hypothetical protein